jgi:tryptophanyl-tRNA synthetase
MKTILTWIKPSADQIHLGNYFWAVKQLLDLQKDNKIFFMIADLHALTTVHEKWFIWRASINQAKIYISCWLDLNNVYLFRQHKIPAHTELNWILSCITPFGTLRRMHAFKDALAKDKHEKISAWVFNYPTLMAADILLYNPDYVPVGQDQKQHVEYAQDIAQKFNNIFWETFKIPKELINKDISKVPGIDGRKMSKSYNNYIWILDDENTLLKKTRRIVTDSIPIGTPKNPDECNVYNILKLFLTENEDKEIRQKYETWNFSFKEMKELAFEKIKNFLKPIQEKYKNLSDEETIKILEENEKKVNEIANENIKKIYQAIWM